MELRNQDKYKGSIMRMFKYSKIINLKFMANRKYSESVQCAMSGIY